MIMEVCQSLKYHFDISTVKKELSVEKKSKEINYYQDAVEFIKTYQSLCNKSHEKSLIFQHWTLALL